MTNKKPTIIFSSYDSINNPYFGGGGAIAIHEVAKRLSRNYKIKIVTGKYPRSRNEKIDNIVYQRVGLSSPWPKFDQAIYQLCLPKLVSSERYDLWLESFTPPISTDFLPLFTRKPVIGVAHMLSGKEMFRKYKLPFYLVENLGLHVYKKVIVLSEDSQKHVKAVNPRVETVIIPNGISNKKIQQLKGKYILFMGRIEIEQKGLDLLLKAYAKMAKSISYPLYIAGSGVKNEEEKLQSLIKTLKLEGKVRLLGKVSGDEKENVYSNAAFVVAPSRYETFSIVSLEAMSFGKALIVFDIDGLKWIPESAAIKVKLFNREALSKAILRLTTKPGEAKQMGRAGYNFSKKFDWNEIAKKYDKFISQTLKEYANG